MYITAYLRGVLSFREYYECLQIIRYQPTASQYDRNAKVAVTTRAAQDYARRCHNRTNRTAFHRSGKRNSRNY